MKHLMQMKEVFPDALLLSCSMLARPAHPGGSAARPEQQTFIEMPLLAASSSQGSLQVPYSSLAKKL